MLLLSTLVYGQASRPVWSRLRQNRKSNAIHRVFADPLDVRTEISSSSSPFVQAHGRSTLFRSVWQSMENRSGSRIRCTPIAC